MPPCGIRVDHRRDSFRVVRSWRFNLGGRGLARGQPSHPSRVSTPLLAGRAGRCSKSVTHRTIPPRSISSTRTFSSGAPPSLSTCPNALAAFDPSGLLEPGAVSHAGCLGAPAQQCAGATRRFEISGVAETLQCVPTRLRGRFMAGPDHAHTRQFATPDLMAGHGQPGGFHRGAHPIAPVGPSDRRRNHPPGRLDPAWSIRPAGGGVGCRPSHDGLPSSYTFPATSSRVTPSPIAKSDCDGHRPLLGRQRPVRATAQGVGSV
jgi:hypothetical protein